MAAGLKGSACPASSLSSLSLSTLIIFMFLSVMLMPYLDHTGGLMGVSRGTSTAAKSNNNNSSSSSSSEIAGKKRENKKKGLYANSPLVVERGPAFVHQRVAEGATLLCVYYATWCPHCRTFVPTFVRLAKQYSLAYGALFVAVDCAEFEAECDRMKVTGYPTVAAYNFPRDQASVTGAFGSRIDGDGVPAYFKSFGMRRAGVDVGQDAEAVAEEDGAATKKSLLRWMEVSLTAKARTASPALRLADALASLEYLLVTETPRLVGTAVSAKESMDALQSLLELVVALLPAQSKAAAWPDLEPEAALRFVREKRGVVVEEKAWKSGIQAALRPAASKNLRSKGGGAVVWSVCGVSVSTKGKDQGHGYTCGLWLLMHFLTVAAAREGEGAAEAVLVQATLRSTISQLFTCSACRTHFLRAFDDCSFNRCAQPNSPLDPTLALPRLQLWLYRLHNAITARILVEKGGSYPETAALRKDARQVLWPDAQVDLGERRGEANIVEPHRVLEHVRGAYWDADWGPLTGLPTADSLLGLLS